jgi:hypothetical protein
LTGKRDIHPEFLPSLALSCQIGLLYRYRVLFTQHISCTIAVEPWKDTRVTESHPLHDLPLKEQAGEDAMRITEIEHLIDRKLEITSTVDVHPVRLSN